MLCEIAKALVLTSVLGGLCSCAQVKTTVAGMTRSSPAATSAATQAGSSNRPLQTAQGGSAVPPPASAVPMQVVPPVISPFPPLPPIKKPTSTRIALLLPLRSEALGQAAEVVRAGFLAAYEREKEESLSITVLETGDAVQEVLSGYSTAIASHDIVVGPLSRSGVAAIAQNNAASKPTIALTQADAPGNVDIVLPHKMLVMGLSIEEEARQVANWAHADKPAGKAFVVSTSTTWQRRAGKAFSTQWQSLGMSVETMELGVSTGYLSASGLVQLKKRIQTEKPSLLFVALDAEQTRQLRESIGSEVPLYGTSQLNPFSLPDWVSADRMPDLNGVHLVDMPWQLQADHPAVMVYPRLTTNADQPKRSADMERLYALGIDAYRVAKEIAANRTNFEIDGVTGKLKVDFGKGRAHFERLELPAVYQDGAVVPLAAAQ